MTNYKTIVTFKNGTHKILRMTRDLVAKFVYTFREMQRNPFGDLYLWPLYDNEAMNMNAVSSVKFINEVTTQAGALLRVPTWGKRRILPVFPEKTSVLPQFVLLPSA